ncbi:MAG: hypothetical protein OXE53_17010 [Deltaproteobacteria bacterium]|nr:hypothetical protein [Deltaproteobacteria bacterium]
MNRIMNYAGCVGRYLRDTRAVAAMEYAIIVGVIVVGVGTAVALFQNEVVDLIQGVTTDVANLDTDIDTAQTDD